MPYTFLVGGARSGKSSLAVRLAEAQESTVVFLATATAGDDEMATRIAEHQASRPEEWQLIEEPVEVGKVVRAVDQQSFLILDCLTLWLSNIFGDRENDRVVVEALTVAEALAVRPGTAVVISNEVGLGIVPGDPLSRRYRDLLGQVNSAFAARSHRSFFLVAGRAIPLAEFPV